MIAFYQYYLQSPSVLLAVGALLSGIAAVFFVLRLLVTWDSNYAGSIIAATNAYAKEFFGDDAYDESVVIAATGSPGEFVRFAVEPTDNPNHQEEVTQTTTRV